MKRVLVCSLDWGLGHATRCIPVVRELHHQGAEVFLASSGDAGVLLKKEFPNVLYHELPAYRPRYQRRGSLVMALAPQWRKFLHVIRMEHEEVEDLVRNLGVEVVISDNRYGCYSRDAESVFLSHQLHVRLPGTWRILEPFLNGRLRRYVNRFQRVWVPDQPGTSLTAGFMDSRIPFSYVGWLSRFTGEQPQGPLVDVMIILSGPEPQRSVFESMILNQVQAFDRSVLLVKGQPSGLQAAKRPHIEEVSHLDTATMEQRMMGAKVIVARSGYSTIMDLIALKKQAVFIPTPGQPEQTWLARHLKREGIAFCCDQENFVLSKAWGEFDTYNGLGSLIPEQGLLKSAIVNLLT